MTVTEVVAIIGALMLIVSTVTASVISVIRLYDEVHDSRDKIASLEAKASKYDALVDEFEDYRTRTRKEIVLMGEALALNRGDNAKLALLVNQLFNQYKDATGEQPKIDFDMLHQMTTISYITGPLGMIDAQAVKRAS